jgi:hypothetical protein
MFEHIKAAEEKLAANLDPRPHLISALHAIATRVDDIGKTADGAVAEQVKAIDERLTSLTAAVTSLGMTVGAQMQRIDSVGSLTGLDGVKKSLGERLAALEAKVAAPAAPPVPTAGANAAAQT